jgi:hypothetical protein
VFRRSTLPVNFHLSCSRFLAYLEPISYSNCCCVANRDTNAPIGRGQSATSGNRVQGSHATRALGFRGRRRDINTTDESRSVPALDTHVLAFYNISTKPPICSLYPQSSSPIGFLGRTCFLPRYDQSESALSHCTQRLLELESSIATAHAKYPHHTTAQWHSHQTDEETARTRQSPSGMPPSSTSTPTSHPSSIPTPLPNAPTNNPQPPKGAHGHHD